MITLHDEPPGSNSCDSDLSHSLTRDRGRGWAVSIAKKQLYGDPDRKPTMLPVNPDGIPEWMRAVRRWVLWRLVWKTNKTKPGKWDKEPFRTTGTHASSTDPASWATFGEVIATYQRGGYDGVGFVLGDGVAGIDADEVRDPESGVITAPWAVDLLARGLGYADVSPSGLGVKIFGRGKWNGDEHKKPHPSGVGEIEVYDSGRYFTVTGHPAGGATHE